MHSAAYFMPPSGHVPKAHVQSRHEKPGADALLARTTVGGEEAFRQKAVKILLVAGLHLGLFAWLAQADSGQREIQSPARLDVRTIVMPSAAPATRAGTAEETKAPAQTVKSAPPRIKQSVPQKQAKQAVTSPPTEFGKPMQESLSADSSNAAISFPAQALQKTSEGTSRAGESAPSAGAASPASGTSGVTSEARFDADYLKNPAPDYPAASRRMREEGTVYLDVNVTAEGKAADLKLRKGSGYARLDEAALDTVRHWRFVPARRGAEAVAAHVVVPVVFRLAS